MHEAGLWARTLLPSLRSVLPALAPTEPLPSEGLVVETLRVAGLLHDVGHGPFAHFFDDRVLAAFPAPEDARRGPGKRLSHEDLSQLIIERELGDVIRALRRAPGATPERDAFGVGEAIDPRWVSFLVSKPPLVDASMPAWVRLLQPLLSGVFTVDNLDYVRRDAFFTGVRVGIDVERLRRYTFVSERGLTLYEPGVAASRASSARGCCSTRPSTSIARCARSTSTSARSSSRPSRRSSATTRRPTVWPTTSISTSTPCSTRPPAGRVARTCSRPATTATAGGLRVTRAVADGWRGILLRRPGWRAEAEIRASYEAVEEAAGEIASLGEPEAGRVTIDLAIVDARPAGRTLAVEGRDGHDIPLGQALSRVPAFALVGRRYRRV
jgi:hypothetical protein